MKGISFSSSSGNHYYYDDDTGIIFPQWQWADNKPPYAGSIIPSPFGNRSLPPENVQVEMIRQHHTGEAYGFRHLILQVHGGCNLRCQYCVFSDSYPYTRSYDDGRMSFQTARKAVDYFIGQHRLIRKRNPHSKPILGFYGGEPLLAFDLIKETIGYFNKQYRDEFPDTMLTLTTNGTLFTEGVQDFLVNNEFSIVISLDGDRETHDRNRRKTDGAGSFEDIIHNIRTFRKRYPDYVRYGISTCYDYKTDFFRMKEFFDNEKLFVVNISQVDTDNTTYYDRFSENDRKEFLDNMKKFYESYARSARENTIKKDSFLFSFIGVKYAGFAFHPVMHERRPAFLPYTAACVPAEKLFVAGDESLHICERINNHFPIGNLDEGVDYTRVSALIDNYNQQVCGNCSRCRVTRFCNRCFANVAVDGTFRLRPGVCNAIYQQTLDSLIEYVDIVEYRPELLDSITVEYHKNILEKVGYFVE